MTKLTFLSAALIATAMVATPALARENRAAVRQHTVTTVDGVTCIRAPDVGAFASDPWTVPPCEPGTIR
jgi:hypothetical protein